MSDANITWLTEQVATGGDFSFDPDKAARQMVELLDMEIDLVIDCRIEDNDEDLWDMSDVTYLHLPAHDNGRSIPTEHFDRAVEAAGPVIEGGGKVFIHCHMGINRGPSTAMAVLLDQGMSAPKAFDLIREKRPEAAVYYAEDALTAHLMRKKVSKSKRTERWSKFRQHYKSVFTDKERRAVQHVIRSNHQRDREDLGLR